MLSLLLKTHLLLWMICMSSGTMVSHLHKKNNITSKKSKISSTAKKIHEFAHDWTFTSDSVDIFEGVFSLSNIYVASQDLKAEFRNEWNDVYHYVTNSHRVSEWQLNDFSISFKNLHDTFMEGITTKRVWIWMWWTCQRTPWTPFEKWFNVDDLLSTSFKHSTLFDIIYLQLNGTNFRHITFDMI